MQQWYGLSDPAMEEALYEIASMRRFAGLSLANGSVPDETTILNFRHLLEANGLATQIFEAVNTYLMAAILLPAIALIGWSPLNGTLIMIVVVVFLVSMLGFTRQRTSLLLRQKRRPSSGCMSSLLRLCRVSRMLSYPPMRTIFYVPSRE
jgi:IS5 family transposase